MGNSAEKKILKILENNSEKLNSSDKIESYKQNNDILEDKKENLEEYSNNKSSEKCKDEKSKILILLY